EYRNRKACKIFHHDDQRKQRDRQAVGAQQRAEQGARFAATRDAFVDRQVITLVVGDPTAPLLLGDVDWLGVGCGHRPSASDVTKRVLSEAARCLYKASCSSYAMPSRSRFSSSSHAQLRSARSSSSSSAASR